MSDTTPPPLILRPAEPRDVAGLVALIDGVYREHGDEIYLAGADSDLLDVDGSYRELGGEFVVLVDPRADAGPIYGAHAVLPLAGRPGVCTFRRLYLNPGLRGRGEGERLMQWAFDWARSQGLVRVEFWSDVRFTRAHRFFARLGFTQTGETREMDDGAMPYREYFFERQL